MKQSEAVAMGYEAVYTSDIDVYADMVVVCMYKWSECVAEYVFTDIDLAARFSILLNAMLDDKDIELGEDEYYYTQNYFDTL